MSDLNGLPSLHPERIREVLRVFRGGGSVLTLAQADTCRSALELVRKAQLAMGLTEEASDALRDAKETAVAGVRLVQTIRRLAGK